MSTDEILTAEAINQSVVNSTVPKDVGSEVDDVEESKNISWNQAADAYNAFIKFPGTQQFIQRYRNWKIRIILNDV